MAAHNGLCDNRADGWFVAGTGLSHAGSEHFGPRVDHWGIQFAVCGGFTAAKPALISLPFVA